MSELRWMETRQRWRREIERLEDALRRTEDPADKIAFKTLLAAHPHEAADRSAEAVLTAARAVLDTELQELACTGSDAPAEHALGLLADAVAAMGTPAAAEPGKGEGN